MSRNFDGDGYADWDPLAEGRWNARVKAVMGGRPALASFRELEAALLALPAPRLIEGEICTEEGDVCAVGAFALHKRVQEGWGDRKTVLVDMRRLYVGAGAMTTAGLGEDSGMTFTLAWLVGEMNDSDYPRWTPEERYAAMLAWTRENIARLEAKHAQKGATA